jgi:hypothetical protein
LLAAEGEGPVSGDLPPFTGLGDGPFFATLSAPHVSSISIASGALRWPATLGASRAFILKFPRLARFHRTPRFVSLDSDSHGFLGKR